MQLNYRQKYLTLTQVETQTFKAQATYHPSAVSV